MTFKFGFGDNDDIEERNGSSNNGTSTLDEQPPSVKARAHSLDELVGKDTYLSCFIISRHGFRMICAPQSVFSNFRPFHSICCSHERHG